MKHFKVIGIKPVFPSLLDENPLHLDLVEAIDKAMYDEPWWHYFYHGIHISKSGLEITVDNEKELDNTLFDTDSLNVSICAVVGKNGSGKSSLVDLLIRVINNLTAALMGEGFNFAAAEHLHYIDHVYADLAFLKDNKFYLLESRGRRIMLKRLSKQPDGVYRIDQHEPILNQRFSDNVRKTPLKKKSDGRNILRRLFYTMVCNYSLYGFNYRDYLGEATPMERLKALGLKIDPIVQQEDTIWMKGLFHKNDGYQTPIVLHPMRHDGRLSVTRENHLAKERLSDLLFYKDAAGEYPLRVINGDLKICALKLSPAKDRRFCSEEMLSHLGIKKTQNIFKNHHHISNLIIKFWDKQYGILEKGRGKELKDDAYDYIVYKTLKIVKSYLKYRPAYTCLRKNKVLYEDLERYLRPLAQDYSHITKKLRQTINYLVTDLYQDSNNYYNLKVLDRIIPETQMKIEKEQGKVKRIRVMRSTLLPPPIFDIELILTKDEHGNGTIPFSRLSSGERQVAYTISNFMYHLVNVDSEWNDFYRGDKDHRRVIMYRYINVVFDEVELYFHPEMQRQFVGLLMKSLRSVHFANLKGLNIMIATHSPFILSDIPGCNILGLGDHNKDLGSTFGANIMEMLGNTFFMEASIGDIARKEIGYIVELRERSRNNDVRDELKKNKKRINFTLEHLGNDFLKSMMHRMVTEIQSNVKTRVRE